MKVFISYAHASAASKKLVSRLADKMREHGISAWADVASAPGLEPTETLRRSIASCDKFVLLIDSAQAKSEAQDFEWRTSLEAVWSDPQKRLIPILIGDVEVPNFVRSTVRAGEPVEAIKIEDPKRDWDEVSDKLVRALGEQGDLDAVAQKFNSIEADRARQQERLTYLKNTAESFKARTEADR